MDVAAASAGVGGEPRRRVEVPTGEKALGFVRRPHRSRGRPWGGPRGTWCAEAAPGFQPPRCPTRVPASTRAGLSRFTAEAWSSRGDRWSGSSTPSRVTGAPPPAAFDGRRRRSTPACGDSCRSWVCSIFTLVAEVGARLSIRRSRSAAEGALDRERPAPFMRFGRKRSARGVRRESVFAECWSKRPAHLARP